VQYTIFDTPVLTPILRGISAVILRIMGWRVDGSPPDAPKYVTTFAPHTSNWDLPMVVFFALIFRIRLLWMGKSSLFRAPYGWIFSWLGGLSIDRSKSNNVVSQAVQYFNDNERLVIGVAPEGTRSHVGEWKTGFYHIANGARVPIATSYLDYQRKLGGFGPTITPTGDAESDIQTIRAFYAGKVGKRPDRSKPPVESAISPQDE